MKASDLIYALVMMVALRQVALSLDEWYELYSHELLDRGVSLAKDIQRALKVPGLEYSTERRRHFYSVFSRHWLPIQRWLEIVVKMLEAFCPAATLQTINSSL
jgi:hypothetical protein